jgi:hypothetical protein
MKSGNLNATATLWAMGGSWIIGFALALCLASCGGSQERLTMDKALPVMLQCIDEAPELKGDRRETALYYSRCVLRIMESVQTQQETGITGTLRRIADGGI